MKAANGMVSLAGTQISNMAADMLSPSPASQKKAGKKQEELADSVRAGSSKIADHNFAKAVDAPEVLSDPNLAKDGAALLSSKPSETDGKFSAMREQLAKKILVGAVRLAGGPAVALGVQVAMEAQQRMDKEMEAKHRQEAESFGAPSAA